VSIIEAIVLGLIQGLTEFIPVSSSGHLLLLHNAFGITEQGLGFDVALHIGTLIALLAFFYRDILQLVSSRSRLTLVLGVATLPAVVAGVLLQGLAETSFRSPVLVCVTMAGMALVMLAAERFGTKYSRTHATEKVSLSQGLVIGIAQAVALVPGISRSGSTITAGLFAGLDRVAATRFSFLLSIPITVGAIIKVTFDQDTLAQVKDETGLFMIGIMTAFVSGVVAIRFLLKFVAKHSLDLFAYYRLILAATAFMLLVAF
jgi:undecaprenyl-diphosphatase